jgi:alkylation response protein AidB-like acyl-CoA dehydrogenase
MEYLIAILVSAALLGGFLALTTLETRRGARFFTRSRERLDVRTARTAFIIRHVDWGASLRDLVRLGFARLVHDLAEGTLALVRTVERILTRTVRYLRERRHADGAPQHNHPLLHIAHTLRRNLRRSKPQEPADGA